MALDQAANFVRETVTSAISAGDTTINVADASPFPVPPEGYNIVVWDPANYARPADDPDVEIMRVTDVDATNDTLTVARGQEGTTDVSHPDTSEAYVAQTAKMIADIASEKISNPVTENVNVDGNDVTNVGELDAEQAILTPFFDETESFSAGEEKKGTFGFDASAGPIGGGDPFIVTVQPANEPGDNIGFEVTAVRYVDSSNLYTIAVKETEGTAGDCRCVVWSLGV